MPPAWWTPGAFRPLEADLGPLNSTIGRWAPGANGMIGRATDELTLAAESRSVRVTVVTGIDPPVDIPGDHEFRALFHWFDAYRHRRPAEPVLRGAEAMAVFDRLHASAVWAPTTVLVDREELPAQIFHPPDPEDRSWVLRLRRGNDRVTIGALGVEPDQLAVRSVHDWSEYGIDLDQAQSASAFGRQAEAFQAWLRGPMS